MAFTGPNDDETLPTQAAPSGFKGPENEAIDPKQLADDESFDPRSFAAEHPDQIDLATNVALERHKRPVTLKGVGHAIMSGGKAAWEGAKTVIPDMLGGIGTVAGNIETEMTSPSELDRARAYKENLAAEAGIEHNIGGLGKAIGNNAAKLYGKITGDAEVSSDDYFKQGFRDSVKDETERRRIASGNVAEDETLLTKVVKQLADETVNENLSGGEGYSAPSGSFGVADMSNENLKPDEVAIRKMESAANPVNLVPLGVPGMGTLANKVGGGVLKGVGGLLKVPAEVAAAALEKTKVGKVITGAGAPAAVIEAAMHPVLAAKIAAGMATAQGAKKLGGLIGGAGDQLLNPKEFTTPMTEAALEAARTPGVNRLTNPAMNAEAGANAFRTTLQGAVTGPIHIAPLAIASTDSDSGNYADEAAGMIGGGIGIGALGGATGAVMHDQRNRLVNEAGRQYRADGDGAAYTNADLSKVSNETIAKLPETERDSINAAKGFFAGKKMRSGADAQIYVLPKDQFGAEVSKRSGESVENSSAQNGYADPKTGEVFINADGDHSASSILGHEGGGHLGVEIARKIIQDSGPVATAKDVVSSVLPSLMKDGAPSPRFNDFITSYNKALHGDGWEMPEKPDAAFLKSMAEEWVSEEARDQIGGRFEDFSVPESIRSAVTKKLGDHYNEWFGTTKSFDRNSIAKVSGVVRDMLHDIAGQKPGESTEAAPEPDAAKVEKTPEAAKTTEPATSPEAPTPDKVNSDARLKSVGIDPEQSDALRDKVQAEAIETEQKRRGKRGFSEASRQEAAESAGAEHDAQVEALVKNLEDNDEVLGHSLQDGLLYNETNSGNGGYTGWINRGDKAKATSIISKSNPLADSVESKTAAPATASDEPAARTREELQAILDKPTATVEDINARNKAQRELEAMGPKTTDEIKAEEKAKASEPIAMPEKTTYRGQPGPDGADQWEIKSLTDNEPRVGDIIVSRDGQIRMVSKPPKGGTIDTIRPFDSINSRGGVTFKDGDYKVAEVDYAKPEAKEGPLADSTTEPVPAMRIVPAEGGRFKIVGPAGNNLKGEKTYATESHAQRGIDRTGKGIDLGNGPGGDPDILNHIDEMGGISPKTDAPEYDGMPDIKGAHTAILGGTESPDRVAENLFRAGLLPDAHTDTLWDAIGNAIRARKSMKEAEATQKAEEARQKAEAKKNPQKPLEDVDTTEKQDGQTQPKKDEPVLAGTITKDKGDTNLDDKTKSPALRETDVAEIARKAEAAEKLKEEHLNKTKLKKGERELTQKGQDAIAVAGINAVAEAHAETVPANYEGVRLRTNAQGDSWIGGRFNPDRPFDAFLLKAADLSKTAIQTLLSLQSQIGQTVRINYRHAIHQGGEVTNESRSQSQKTNTADMRAAGEGKWEDRDKHVIPLSVYFNKGSATKSPSITVHGASPEKLFRNFKSISEELAKLGEEAPYPNVHSDAFIRDMRGGIENHRNGWKFDGSARVKSDAPDVNIPKASEDFIPHKIDADKAEFINLLMGDESAKAGKRSTAEQAIQRELKRGLAVENGIPMVKTGEDAGEVNPLRKAINDLNGKIPVMEVDPVTKKLVPKLDKDNNPVTTTWSRKNIENPLSEDIRPDLTNKIYPDIDNSDESIRPHGFQGDISSPFEKGQPNKTFVASGFMPKEGKPLESTSIKSKSKNDEGPLSGVAVKDDKIYNAPGKTIDVSEDTKGLPEGSTLVQDGGLWIVKDKAGKILSASGSRAGTIAQANGTGVQMGNATVTRPQAHFLPAFHGTPHKVDKFSLDKIGTGEGAQAYGWGLYFAQHPNVADEYRKILTNPTEKPIVDGKHFDSSHPDYDKLDGAGYSGVMTLAKHDGDAKAAIADIHAQADEHGIARDHKSVKARIDAINEFSGRTRNGYTQGNLYTVDLDVNHDHLLDWDKPLSEQSKFVRDALEKIPSLTNNPEYAKFVTSQDKGVGGYIYKALADMGNSTEEGSKKASEILNSVGVKGVRYLDAASRADGATKYNVKWDATDTKAEVFDRATKKSMGVFDSFREADQWVKDHADESTRNFVVFDEKAIKITHENGKAVSAKEATDNKFMPYAGPRAKDFGKAEEEGRVFTGALDNRRRFEIDDSGAKMTGEYQELAKNSHHTDGPITVDSLTYRENEDGTYRISAIKKDAKTTKDFLTYDKIRASEVSDLFGDETLKKMKSGEGEEDFIGNDMDEAKNLKLDKVIDVPNGAPLSSVMDHSELFKQYPELAKVPVVVTAERKRGAAFVMMPDGSQHIEISPTYGDKDAKRILLHEIQHWIQEKEGFAKGSGPETERRHLEYDRKIDSQTMSYLANEMKFLRDTDGFKATEEKYGKSEMTDADLKERNEATEMSQYLDMSMRLAKLSKKYMISLRELRGGVTPKQAESMMGQITPDELFERYYRSAGEIESRDVEARHEFDDDKRKETPPFSSNKIPLEDVIVRTRRFMPSSKVTPEQDKSYMDAVDNGDEKEAQKLVNEAAEDAGYQYKKFHQTSPEAKAAIYREGFRLDKGRARLSDDQVPDAFFFKADPSDIGVGAADGAAQIPVFLKFWSPKLFNDRAEVDKWAMEDDKYRDVRQRLAKYDKEQAAEFDRRWDALRVFDTLQNGKSRDGDMLAERRAKKAELELDKFTDQWTNGSNELAAEARAILTDRLKNEGHDAVTIYNDKGSFNRSAQTTVVFNPEQIKSADPITRDENGKVIPISKRFDDSTSDIRFMPKSLEQIATAHSKYIDAFATMSTSGDKKIIKLAHLQARKDAPKGAGSAYMEDLTKFADENGLTIALETATKGDLKNSTYKQTSSMDRLKKFYARFGFKSNYGKRSYRADLPGNMHREPSKAKGAPLEDSDTDPETSKKLPLED